MYFTTCIELTKVVLKSTRYEIDQDDVPNVYRCVYDVCLKWSMFNCCHFPFNREIFFFLLVSWTSFLSMWENCAKTFPLKITRYISVKHYWNRDIKSVKIVNVNFCRSINILLKRLYQIQELGWFFGGEKFLSINYFISSSTSVLPTTLFQCWN